MDTFPLPRRSRSGSWIGYAFFAKLYIAKSSGVKWKCDNLLIRCDDKFSHIYCTTVLRALIKNSFGIEFDFGIGSCRNATRDFALSPLAPTFSVVSLFIRICEIYFSNYVQIFPSLVQVVYRKNIPFWWNWNFFFTLDVEITCDMVIRLIGVEFYTRCGWWGKKKWKSDPIRCLSGILYE